MSFYQDSPNYEEQGERLEHEIKEVIDEITADISWGFDEWGEIEGTYESFTVTVFIQDRPEDGRIAWNVSLWEFDYLGGSGWEAVRESEGIADSVEQAKADAIEDVATSVWIERDNEKYLDSVMSREEEY